MTPQILQLSDGAAVRLRDLGDGEPILLIHGVGMRLEAWEPQIAALSTRWRVLAADMPGHGESDPLPEGAGLADFVAWAARLIETLACGPVNLVGHSMGALIASGVAIERPELVRRLALLNAVHRRTPVARAAVLARAEDIAQGRTGIESALERWFGPGDEAVRDHVADWFRTIDQQGYLAAYRAFARGDTVYADRLGEIAVPALLLTGENDPNSTPAMSRAMAALMPRGEARIVDGHRHMVNLTAPEMVTAALEDLLAREEACP
ncbi:alpha/beta fold hydrolase [Pelagibacterium lacus]|uniref:Alpha/beta fold hydrolase n=1 Tax=Pelagibacterium lacus TaxID=2282655 RepID=A0A369W3I0_9HYPH|nr:alpha/beta hydrolase [Pelagibacterium lacus]RDE08599.1 alpha/beta fold hydrolase [Pelagibacterium lacus]